MLQYSRSKGLFVLVFASTALAFLLINDIPLSDWIPVSHWIAESRTKFHTSGRTKETDFENFDLISLPSNASASASNSSRWIITQTLKPDNGTYPRDWRVFATNDCLTWLPDFLGGFSGFELAGLDCETLGIWYAILHNATDVILLDNQTSPVNQMKPVQQTKTSLIVESHKSPPLIIPETIFGFPPNRTKFVFNASDVSSRLCSAVETVWLEVGVSVEMAWGRAPFAIWPATFALFSPVSTRAHYSALWALPFIGRGTGSLWAQALLHLSGGVIVFHPVEGRLAHSPLPTRVEETLDLLAKWRCSTTSVAECGVLLARHLANAALWSPKDADRVQAYFRLLQRAGFRFPDFRKPKWTCRPTTVSNLDSPTAVHRGVLEAFCGPGKFNQPPSKPFIPLWPRRNQWDRTLLLITFNYDLPQNFGLLQALYANTFAQVIFCSSTLEPDGWRWGHLVEVLGRAQTKGRVLGMAAPSAPLSHIFLSPTEMYRGFFAYRCLLRALELGLRVESVLMIADDNLVRPWLPFNFTHNYRGHNLGMKGLGNSFFNGNKVGLPALRRATPDFLPPRLTPALASVLPAFEAAAGESIESVRSLGGQGASPPSAGPRPTSSRPGSPPPSPPSSPPSRPPPGSPSSRFGPSVVRGPPRPPPGHARLPPAQAHPRPRLRPPRLRGRRRGVHRVVSVPRWSGGLPALRRATPDFLPPRLTPALASVLPAFEAAAGESIESVRSLGGQGARPGAELLQMCVCYFH